ncbi:MAG: ATPase [Legionellales bacterium]|nr:ATPase [Legionellales bacterium]|tara:strand:+ start:485 stop:1525 length:1041 start_codon:yes stop_codon:yes gene_type:complete
MENVPACHQKKKFDFLLWGSLSGVAILYLLHWQLGSMIAGTHWLVVLSETVFELMNTVWWGILIGILMVAVLSKIPREFVMAILGEGGGFKGILRATLGGVLLDLCSHGILMVGAKLYERGASTGQVMAFLIASPWNSFSLTLILIALIGIPWTLGFIFLSMAIAIVTGMVFDRLVSSGILPSNPNTVEIDNDFMFWQSAKAGIMRTTYNWSFFKNMSITGIKESRMVLKWIFFGLILAGLVRAFVDTASFETYFGPTLAGLGLTVLVATIMEVCSEGSTPIAADILTRAKSPGNSFAFLMTGVSTDYTEILILKDATKSWKVALFLPLITLPQVMGIAWLINTLA